jgi:threonine dehydratase
VYDVARESELESARLLSQRLNNRVWLKREDLQPVFSFKLRGAYQKISQLTAEELSRGIIAASAGNHAQGVALAAHRLKARALIFMPRTTPAIKVQAVEDLGAEVRLTGDTYDEACEAALSIAAETGAVFVHPYDDPDVIAGQGTIARELIQQARGGMDAVFVPVGGGGLLAGISVYLKSIAPGVKVIGVEPEEAASMAAALAAGKPVALETVGLFADGAAVRKVGEETFRLCRGRVDAMIQVSTDEICAAIKDVYEDTRSILEPAGALSVAGMKKWVAKHRVEGQDLVAIACGANMNFDRLRHVSERAELGEGREAIFGITIPELPGTMRQLIRLIGDLNVTEFNYRYSAPGAAHVFLGVQIPSQAARDELAGTLRGAGFGVLDMSENELTKIHLRHLVGGMAAGLESERLYRFEFPERPGALMRFLNEMPMTWNISLFHYRNHGAAYGRVLAGLEIPSTEQAEFESFISELGYTWSEETENPAVELFLSGCTHDHAKELPSE